MAKETVRLAQAADTPSPVEEQGTPVAGATGTGAPQAAPGTPEETEGAPQGPEGDAAAIAGETAGAEASAGADTTALPPAGKEAEPQVQTDTRTEEVVPGAPEAPFEIGQLPEWTLLAGGAATVLLVFFFITALVRARRRRRREIAGEAAAPEIGEGAPLERPAPEGEPAAEAPSPVEPAREDDKASRRQAFLAEQARIRAERESAAAQAAAEAAQAEAETRAQAEAEARAREEEEQRRLEALLAPSGSLTQGLARTRGGFMARLDAVLGKQLDEAALEELEEVLFTADIGVKTASRLLETVRGSLSRKEASDPKAVREAVRRHIVEVLRTSHPAQDGEDLDPNRAGGSPYVLMVVGVNGVGKTTTIGKLAGRLIARGHRVVLAAGDTFRAAAVEQLAVWADRVGAEVVRGEEGADPGSVVFEAVNRARETGADVVICDTAGRLHTKVPLMEELQKVHRVLGKAREGAPDDVLLVVDATTGQNAIQQARLFSEVVPLTGLALTKLDGTAKGGVILGISDELRIPVRYIGVGEKVGDLRPFEPDAFAEALFA